MADYQVYKYYFVPSSVKNMPAKAEDAEAVRLRLSKFLAIAKIYPIIKHVRKTKESEAKDVVVNAYVDKFNKDIALIDETNYKNLSQYEERKKTPNPIDSFPSCNVIIDNRKGVQQILIQKSSAFNSNPDSAMKLLRNILSSTADEVSWDVVIKKKILSGMVWDEVEAKRLLGKCVTYVKYKFIAPAQADVKGSREQYLLDMLTLHNSVFGAAETTFEHLADNNVAGLQFFKNINSDCYHLVELCTRNGYDMEIRFSDNSLIHTVDESVAMYTIPDEEINEFNEGSIIEGYKIVRTLDYIRNSTENYGEKDF